VERRVEYSRVSVPRRSATLAKSAPGSGHYGISCGELVHTVWARRRRTSLTATESRCVMALSKSVRVERGINVDVELIRNLRSRETAGEEFEVDASRADERLGWAGARQRKYAHV